MLTIIIIILILLLSTIIGLNHTPVLISSIVKSGISTYKKILLISILGTALGIIIEGKKMKIAKIIFLGETSNIEIITIVILLSAFIVVMIASIKKIPISLSQSLFGGFIAIFFLYNYNNSASFTYIILTLVSWFAVPLIVFLFTYLIISFINKLSHKLGIINTYILLKSFTLISVFYISYIFGANTLGFISSLLPTTPHFYILFTLLIVFFTYVGILLAGQILESKLSEEMYTLGIEASFGAYTSTALLIEIVTQFGIPMSITQAIIAGLLGVTFTRKLRLPNIRVIRDILIQWILSPILSFLITLMILILITLL